MYKISKRIEDAETLPGNIYHSNELYEGAKEKIFAKSWQVIGNKDLSRLNGDLYPFYYMENYIDEPLLLARNQEGKLNCMSNVCTHRGNILIEHPCQGSEITCCYHGRRFDLNGCFKSMPEFQNVENFPTERDHLTHLPLKDFASNYFTSLDPAFDFEEVYDNMRERLSFMNLDELIFDESRSQDYLVKANWALYVENYLEGFHIPFVHPSLAKAIDFKNYSSEIYPYHNLQLGIVKSGEPVFDIPEGHPDYGLNVGAYYYWVFPNLMFNFYPWGLSLNIIKPLDQKMTKVSFQSFVANPQMLGKGAGGDLDTVEKEDEAIVEKVMKGVGSRFYDKGRYSVRLEKGVHHFHSLIADFLNKGES